MIVPYYTRHPKAAINEQGYAAVAELRNDETVANEALTYEFDRVIAILERAVGIAEGLGLQSQVGELLERVNDVYKAIPARRKRSKVLA